MNNDLVNISEYADSLATANLCADGGKRPE